jgi:hypothetical protein
VLVMTNDFMGVRVVQCLCGIVYGDNLTAQLPPPLNQRKGEGYEY